jgi:hypothetical protein
MKNICGFIAVFGGCQYAIGVTQLIILAEMVICGAIGREFVICSFMFLSPVISSTYFS